VVLEGSLLTSIAGFESTSHFSRGAFDFTAVPGGTFLISAAIAKL
jgi:hypothetical protein